MGKKKPFKTKRTLASVLETLETATGMLVTVEEHAEKTKKNGDVHLACSHAMRKLREAENELNELLLKLVKKK